MVDEMFKMIDTVEEIPRRYDAAGRMSYQH